MKRSKTFEELKSEGYITSSSPQKDGMWTIRVSRKEPESHHVTSAHHSLSFYINRPYDEITDQFPYTKMWNWLWKEETMKIKVRTKTLDELRQEGYRINVSEPGWIILINSSVMNPIRVKNEDVDALFGETYDNVINRFNAMGDQKFDYLWVFKETNEGRLIKHPISHTYSFKKNSSEPETEDEREMRLQAEFWSTKTKDWLGGEDWWEKYE